MMKSKDHIRWQNVSELVEMLDIRRVGNKDRRFANFRCIHCATEFEAPYYKNQYPKSCECEAQEKHGDRNNPLYGKWDGMKQRCCNTKQKCYKNYGGRGITVCEEWVKSFSKFRDWANVNGYKKGLVLDRRDNNEGYSPENCRFVTQAVNNQNMRTTKMSMVKAREVRLIYSEGDIFMNDLARIYNVSNSVISNIIHNKAWIDND